MARGRKNITLEEQLETVNSKIDTYTEELKLLKEQKKIIEQEICTKELNEIYDLMKTSGRSMADLKLLLAN